MSVYVKGIHPYAVVTNANKCKGRCRVVDKIGRDRQVNDKYVFEVKKDKFRRCQCIVRSQFKSDQVRSSHVHQGHLKAVRG